MNLVRNPPKLSRCVIYSSPLDGTCYICNECGDNEDDSDDECSGPSQSTASSTCTEITAYTLLALLNNEDDEYVFCLASWLAKQKNRFGIFGSSQVIIHTAALVQPYISI